MNLGISENVKPLLAEVRRFIEEEVLPVDHEYAAEVAVGDRWQYTDRQQLLEAMSISRSSFYAAFGGKRAIYEESLTQFAERTRSFLRSVAESKGPVAATREFFEATLLRVPRRRRERGCMMINTVLEMAEVEPDLNRVADRLLKRVEDDFEALFERASSRGYKYTMASGDLAQFVMLLNQGLRVASRRAATDRELQTMLDASMSILSLSIQPPNQGE